MPWPADGKTRKIPHHRESCWQFRLLSAAAALRGVAIQTRRAQAAFPTRTFARLPTPLTNATAANTLHGYAPWVATIQGVFSDDWCSNLFPECTTIRTWLQPPKLQHKIQTYSGYKWVSMGLTTVFETFGFLCKLFLLNVGSTKKSSVSEIVTYPNCVFPKTPTDVINFQAAAAAAQPALLKTPMAQSQQAYSTAFNTARAINAAGLAQVQAAQAQPVTAASYAALSGWDTLDWWFENKFLIRFQMVDRYGREYTDPYLGHSIGPVPGYQVRPSPICSCVC